MGKAVEVPVEQPRIKKNDTQPGKVTDRYTANQNWWTNKTSESNKISQHPEVKNATTVAEVKNAPTTANTTQVAQIKQAPPTNSTVIAQAKSGTPDHEAIHEVDKEHDHTKEHERTKEHEDHKPTDHPDHGADHNHVNDHPHLRDPHEHPMSPEIIPISQFARSKQNPQANQTSVAEQKKEKSAVALSS